MKMFVEIIENQANINPNGIAIYSKNEKMTYKELYELAKKEAIVLLNSGMNRGDKIMLEAIPRTDFFVAFLAVQFAGGISVPIQRSEKNDKIEYILELINSPLYLCSSNDEKNIPGKASYSVLRKTAQEIDKTSEYIRPKENDLAEIIFTTGSTGNPKGVMLTHRAISTITDNTRIGIGIENSDTILVPLPLQHSFALRVIRAAFSCGSSIVLQNSAVSVRETKENISSYNCTAMISVATAMEVMLNSAGEDEIKKIFNSLRFIEFSAGAMNVKLRNKMLSILPNIDIHNTWGSSETGGCLFIDIGKHVDKIESMGKPINGVEANIVDENGNFILENGPEHTGKLALKGDMLMSGYFERNDLTAKCLKNEWYIVNDLVWRDSEGWYYMVGRSDDIINVGGEKVSPVEIEESVREIEGVLDCICFGVKDNSSEMGEVPILFYSADIDKIKKSEQISKLLSTKLSAYKIPKKIIRIASIPHNSMGKPDRKILKKQWEKRYKTGNKVIECIFNRRSVRDFLEKEVPNDLVDLLLECGKVAPSGKNLKTRKFTVLQNKTSILKLKEAIKKEAIRNKKSISGFNNPPLVILISNDKRNKDGIQDVGCSAENIMLAADSLGLSGVWLNPLMELGEEESIRKLLDEWRIPQNHVVWAVMAIGFPAIDPPIPEEKGNDVYYVDR